MPKCYINSYRPLVSTAEGRRASEKHRVPPFVDGSIRREPDLEHAFPSITCLCRAKQFTPRLHVGDYIAFMTVKGSYDRRTEHRRLTAVLEVLKVRPNHSEAAK